MASSSACRSAGHTRFSHGREDKRIVTTTVGPVFVGDLWVLAGQSNMEGVGDLVDVTPPASRS